MVYEAIKKLVRYGLDTGLITEVDRIYATNQILDVLKLERSRFCASQPSNILDMYFTCLVLKLERSMSWA